MTDQRMDSPTRAVKTFLTRATAALVLVSLIAPVAAFANPKHVKPSTQSLARLAQYEPYITYFTALSYGPLGHKVSADYIRALILTESAAQKFAVSNKGARGLTQIMPETGRMAAGYILNDGTDYEYIDEARLVRYNADVLYDPSVNILMACYLGAMYHADYSGRSDLSAAAWNAGPEAVARYGNRIPNYRETRGMVARLVGYLNYFSAFPVSTQPGQLPSTATASANAGSGVNWSDPSHSRWNTRGWNDPGWDEKKVNWELPF